MGIETTSQETITCDNPECPGTELDPTDRRGWVFVTAEVYGQPVTSHVFCSFECAAAGAEYEAKAREERAAAAAKLAAAAERGRP